ncbi:LANO_0D06744g1_1 [Lachancea nothofagi CBS 11611]|uniref:ATPase synthesis protein 25 n=1 Tax=Lachancea nothofagi CBS 11611 TaxID=1266666 RepID=A0A1G4JHQ5_9SACH|nr:LANO_0D06744g1_1 [Lachancea nothofagi CBS 11611]
MLVSRVPRALRSTRSCSAVWNYYNQASPLFSGFKRLYSSDPQLKVSSETPATEEAESSNGSTTATAQPWYLNVVKDQIQETSFQLQELSFPRDSPESLRALTTFLRDDLGLSDIIIFDLRESKDSQTTAVARISDFIVMATARSGKHCHKSFIEINALLKQKFQTLAHVEGNISANELRRRQRRLARHTNLSKNMGSRSPTTRSGAQTESWYMIDCHLDNIFINVLTENRRKELNLEELYAAPEDKHLYRRQEMSSEVTPDEDDDNVLAGLKRLAVRNQRRYYSTISDRRLIVTELSQQNFERAYSLVRNQPSLHVLKTINSALESMPSNTPLQVENWLQFFNHVWSAQDAQKPEYWELRLHFLQLLNCSKASQFGADDIFSNYLQFKLASGVQISKTDLTEFLRLICNNLQEGTNNYEELARTNQTVVEALKLYKGIDPQIILDEEVMCLVLQTMSNSKTSLKALNEMISYVCAEFSPQIPGSVISTILQALSQNREYLGILKFWERGIDLKKTNDYRPWHLFVNTIANSEDQSLMKKVLNDGHLLWIKRNNIEMSPQLRNALDKLFIAVDPENIAYEDLKDFLVDGPK